MAEESNCVPVDIVRITHRELMNIAEHLNYHDSEDFAELGDQKQSSPMTKENGFRPRKKESKKPELAIYRPGSGLLPKRHNRLDNELEGSSTEFNKISDGDNNETPSAVDYPSDLLDRPQSSLSQCSEAPERDRRNKIKRPDLQRYVPKQRAAMMRDSKDIHQNTGANSHVPSLDFQRESSLEKDDNLSISTKLTRYHTFSGSSGTFDHSSSTSCDNLKHISDEYIPTLHLGSGDIAIESQDFEKKAEETKGRPKSLSKDNDLTKLQKDNSQNLQKTSNTGSFSDSENQERQWYNDMVMRCRGRGRKTLNKEVEKKVGLWKEDSQLGDYRNTTNKGSISSCSKLNRNDGENVIGEKESIKMKTCFSKAGSTTRESPFTVSGNFISRDMETEDWEPEIAANEAIAKAASQENISKAKTLYLDKNRSLNIGNTKKAKEKDSHRLETATSKAENAKIKEGKLIPKTGTRVANRHAEDSTFESNKKQLKTLKDSPTESLDWGEEVERSEQLSQMAESSPPLTQPFSYLTLDSSDPDSSESPQTPNKNYHKNTKKKKKKKIKQFENTGGRQSDSKDIKADEPVRTKQKGGGIIWLPVDHQTEESTKDSVPSIKCNDNSTTSCKVLYDPHNPHPVPYKVSHDQMSPNEVYCPPHSMSYQGTSTHMAHMVFLPDGYNNHNLGHSSGFQVQGYHYMPYMSQEMPFYPVTPPITVGSDFSAASSNKLSTAQRNVREAMMLESELNYHLTFAFDKMDIKKMSQCRWKIQLRYENAILSDLDYCTKHNIEQSLWKSAFYQVIETFRKQMVDLPAQKENIKKALLSFIEEGNIFYENLLEKLQETHGFPLAQFLDSDALRPQTLSRMVRLGLLSAQKVIICLGDLARYREQTNETSNYGKARNWYMKAQQLAPKNGRPYNQLAILALYARRKLDAVYYYIRSLAASNPFQTARESLISLFDEARKKYEQVEKKRAEERYQQERATDVPARSTAARREVWFLPDGTSSQQSEQPDGHTEPTTSDDDLNKLTTIQLNKKFVLSFLHVHGKLFTKIGMETFVETATQMVREFSCLLQHSPAPVSSSRLLQLMAINMYAIHNTQLKDPNLEPNCRSVLQDHALQVSLEMFRLLLRRCLALLRLHVNSCENSPPPPSSLPDDLHQLLPPIKVWCDWLMCHGPTWNPPPSHSDYGNSGEDDVWSHLAELFNLVKIIDSTSIHFRDRNQGGEPVVLPESTALAGFVPLLSLPQEPVFAMQPFDKEVARTVLRFQRLQYCADYLCGIVPPVLRYDVPKKAYLSVVADPSNDSTDEDDRHQLDILSYAEHASGSSDESDRASYTWDEDLDDPSLRRRPEIERLRSRKEELEKKREFQEKQKQQIQAVLDATNSSQLVMEIRPHQIVPDTNCFIDHLSGIKTIVDSKYFQLTVPLVVVNELDGLARGCRPLPTGEIIHGQQVVRGARDALNYLTHLFSTRNPHVKAVTSKGSELDTITFRSEDMGGNIGTNDDLILNCCLQYCNETPSRHRVKGGKNSLKRLIRRVVLLTDDRNLRVKAHAADVPTRDVISFLRLVHLE